MNENSMPYALTPETLAERWEYPRHRPRHECAAVALKPSASASRSASGPRPWRPTRRAQEVEPPPARSPRPPDPKDHHRPEGEVRKTVTDRPASYVPITEALTTRWGMSAATVRAMMRDGVLLAFPISHFATAELRGAVSRKGSVPAPRS